MTEVILREQQVRIPIRLEKGIEQRARGIDLVFVAVDQVGISSDRGDAGQRIFGQLVVVIQQDDVVAGRERECGVGRRGDVPVAVAEGNPHPRVLPGSFFEDPADVRRS